MAWRIVKQPNGLYARFSDVVDHFVLWNATRKQMVNAIVEEQLEEARRLAEEKLQAADTDKTWDGTGNRWTEALATIKMRHGQEKHDKFLAEYNDVLKAAFFDRPPAPPKKKPKPRRKVRRR